MTKTINLTKEERFLLFDLILDNFPEDKQLQHKFATIYNKIGGVIKWQEELITEDLYAKIQIKK